MSNNSAKLLMATTLVCGSAVYFTSDTTYAGGAPAAKSVVAQVMDDGFKGSDGKGTGSLVTKVNTGVATDAEKKQLLDLVKKLPEGKPTKVGADPDAQKVIDDKWAARTKAIITATQDVVDGKPNAAADFKTSVTCMTCHADFKAQAARGGGGNRGGAGAPPAAPATPAAPAAPAVP